MRVLERVSCQDGTVMVNNGDGYRVSIVRRDTRWVRPHFSSQPDFQNVPFGWLAMLVSSILTSLCFFPRRLLKSLGKCEVVMGDLVCPSSKLDASCGLLMSRCVVVFIAVVGGVLFRGRSITVCQTSY